MGRRVGDVGAYCDGGADGGRGPDHGGVGGGCVGAGVGVRVVVSGVGVGRIDGGIGGIGVSGFRVVVVVVIAGREDAGGFGVFADAVGAVVVDGGEGAEDEAGDVGERLGAADGDGVSGEEFIELDEIVVDALGVLEILGAAEEDGGDVGGLFGGSLVGEVPGEVLGAEAGGVRGEETALTAAGGEAMGAAGHFWSNAGARLCVPAEAHFGNGSCLALA